MGLGHLDCDTCDDDQKEELGCYRFGNKIRARKWTLIDYTGDGTHDRVRFCPRSCVDPGNAPPGRVDPGLILRGLERYSKIKACGGLADFQGEPPADCPPRVAWFFATVDSVVSRYIAEVRDTQTTLSNRAAASVGRRGIGQGIE